MKETVSELLQSALATLQSDGTLPADQSFTPQVGNTYAEGPRGSVQFVSGGERHLKFWHYTPEPTMGMPNVDPDGVKASSSGLRSVRALYKVCVQCV